MKDNILLAISFAKRDFKERYIGTSLGQVWFILSPIIMITIYSIVFSEVMMMKLDLQVNKYAYSIYLVPGILAWTSFSTMISKLTNSFSSKASLLKKINVPMYSFMLAILLTEVYVMIISMIFAVIFLLIVDYPISFAFFWLIPLIILQSLFAFSLGVIIALFTPFLKDIKVVIPIVLQLWFWLTPIVYLKTMVEDKYPLLLVYNPFFYFVDIYHDIFLLSKTPSLESILIIVIMTTTTLFIAAYLYKKMIATIKDII